MGYLIGEILVCLLLAFLLGAFLYWLLFGRSWKQKLADAETEWSVRHQKLKGDYRALEVGARDTAAELESRNNDVTKLEAGLQDAQTKISSAESTFATLMSEHKGLKKTHDDLTAEIERLQADVVSRDTDLGIERGNIKTLEDKRNALQAAVDERAAQIVALGKDGDSYRARIRTLEASEKSLNEIIAALRRDLDTAGDEGENQLRLISSLKDEQLAHERQLADVQGAISSLDAEKQSLFGDLNNDRAEIARLRADLDASRAKFKPLEAELQDKDRALGEAGSRLSKLETEHQGCLKDIGRINGELDKLRKATASHESSLRDAERNARESAAAADQRKASIRDLEADLKRCREARQAMEAKLKKAIEKPKMAAYGLKAPQGRADDLKRIKGVGPKLEGILHGLGIFHFRQIAKFTTADVAWVSKYLAEFKGRIERDDWIRQADALHRDDYNEAPE